MRIGRLEIRWCKKIDDREWQEIADEGNKVGAVKVYRELYRTKKGPPTLKKSRDAVWDYLGLDHD